MRYKVGDSVTCLNKYSNKDIQKPTQINKNMTIQQTGIRHKQASHREQRVNLHTKSCSTSLKSGKSKSRPQTILYIIQIAKITMCEKNQGRKYGLGKSLLHC